MSRVQLALNVDDLDEAVTFYSKLFNTEPAKRKPGYANFAVAEPPLKLVLLENPGNGGTLNHLGVEVQSSEKVHEEITRLSGEGLFTDEEIGTTCCFATQDKVWVTGPAGEKWEVYTVLADSETFGTSPQHLDPDTDDAVCCGGESIREELCIRGEMSLTTCPTKTRTGWTPSWSRRSTTPTPNRGCATLKALPRNWVRTIRARPHRCARGWKRCSPSHGSASTAASPKH